jgi:chaperone BCS1
MTSNVGLQPFSPFQRSLFSVATSLSSTEVALPTWLTLDPKRALQNGIAVVSSTSSSLNTFTAVLFAFGSLGAGFYIYIWKNAPLRSAVSWLSSRFAGSISIASTHPLNKDVLTHLEKAGLSRKTNSLALLNSSTGVMSPEMLRGIYIDQRAQPPMPMPHVQKLVELEPEALEYVPVAGTYSFWHNGYRMILSRREDITGYYQDDGKFVRTESGLTDASRSQTLTITCWSLGAGVQPVKDFLEYVREVSKPSKHNTTTIFRAACHKEQQKFHWDTGVSRPARTVDSIALESGKKRQLMKECTRYFSKEDERFHASRGIPYRRGLLFYGPPGTGKTSFTVALAGHFNLNVYMVSMSDGALNDVGLGKLFDTLPRRCIVLLEDIDSSGIDREPRKEVIKSSRDPSRVSKTVTVGVSLSGLLNVLDGPASVDGRLVVMTSNSPDSLDAALLRPGRIDSKVLFGYTNREVSGQIFMHIFTKTADEILLASKDDDGEEKEEGEDWPSNTTTDNLSPSALLAMSKDFAACIPDTKVSPAEIQGFLMRHRDDPAAAVANADAWARELLAVKKQGKNVAAFDNEIKRGGALFAGGKSAHLPPPLQNGVSNNNTIHALSDEALAMNSWNNPHYATHYAQLAESYRRGPGGLWDTHSGSEAKDLGDEFEPVEDLRQLQPVMENGGDGGSSGGMNGDGSRPETLLAADCTVEPRGGQV